MSLRNLGAMLRDESGAALTEYGLVVALLSAGAMAVLLLVAASANGAYNNITQNMQAFQTATPP